MARQKQEAFFVIGQGPSKLDLMLSLFDTDMGKRTVRFQIAKSDCDLELDGRNEWLEVQIISARRRSPCARIWELEGIVQIHGKEKRAVIYYTSDTRKGYMEFAEEIMTSSAMEVPIGTRKADALMIIIQKMIGRYRNSHRGNLDDEIFRLLEKAKVVSWAKDSYHVGRAVENIIA